jgi:hypothetical protein
MDMYGHMIDVIDVRGGRSIVEELEPCVAS